MKVTIKGYITCKSAEQYIDCADNYAVNIGNHRFSVSDGVSKSFFPKVWSEILVTQFVERTDLKESELIKVCQDEWQKRIDEIVSLPETKWFTKSQYNRKDPALATFVGLQFFGKEKMWTASALGDSFLFFIPTGYKDYLKELVKLSSKVEPIIFDNFPDYLTSIGESHKGNRKDKSGSLKDGTFYLMTDALAEWFLNEGENAIGKITVWKSQSDFERFIALAIDENKMTNDDSAILCIELTESDRKGIEYKKIQVTDLNDLINKQAENHKAIQKKLEGEKLRKEQEVQIQDAEQSSSTESDTEQPVQEMKVNEELSNSGFFSIVKGLFSGKEIDKETSSEKKVESESNEIIEQSSEEVTKADEKNVKTEMATTTDLNDEKKEEIKIIDDISEKTIENIETKELETKEQPKIDSKAKNIFDKF